MKGQPSTTIPKLDEYNLDKIEKNLVSTLMTTYPNAPIREIADVMGVSERTVYRILKRTGFKRDSDKVFCLNCGSDVTSLPNFYREHLYGESGERLHAKGKFFCTNCNSNITRIKMKQLFRIIEKELKVSREDLGVPND